MADDNTIDLMELVEIHSMMKNSSAMSAWNKMSELENGKIIYHYTKHDILQCITKSLTLRGTHLSHLNDALEYKYGIELLNEVCQTVLASISNKSERLLIENINNYKIHFESVQVFAICFCNDKDLFHQWKIYGHNGNGVCIGFDANKLHEKCEALGLAKKISGNEFERRTSVSWFGPRKVVYDRISQIGILTTYMNTVLEKYRQMSKDGMSNPKFQAIKSVAISLMSEYLYCFKHPSYAAEQEYRIIGYVNDFAVAKLGITYEKLYEAAGILFTASEFSIRPQATFKFGKNDFIKEIINGPTAKIHPGSTHGISIFLRSIGIESIKISDSQIIIQ